jgi:hypothetical protein
MASTALNVPNPIVNPTAAQLGQVAANIAGTITTGIKTGSFYEDPYDFIVDLASGVNLCAQALLTIANATASSVGTVNVANRYAVNQPIPTNINTAAN